MVVGLRGKHWRSQQILWLDPRAELGAHCAERVVGLAPHYAEGVVGLAADSGENYVRLVAVHQGEWKKFYLGLDRKLD